MLVNSIDSATGANQSAVVTTLMMTERRVNVLHYATSLSGVTHASEFRQMDLSLHHSFIWIQVNNSLSNLKENNDQTRDSEHSRGPFILPGKKKKALNLIWKSARLREIFTEQMSVHCLLVSEVSRERRGVQPWLEALLPTKEFNCSAQIGYLSQSSK